MKNKTFYVITNLLLAAGIVFWVWMFQNPSPDTHAGAFEQSEATGISVPGMPIGSPGMEQGFRKDPYNVILFDESGNRSVYARY